MPLTNDVADSFSSNSINEMTSELVLWCKRILATFPCFLDCVNSEFIDMLRSNPFQKTSFPFSTENDSFLATGIFKSGNDLFLDRFEVDKSSWSISMGEYRRYTKSRVIDTAQNVCYRFT